jgi:drug/metabolite transporter (DMT)-like permease
MKNFLWLLLLAALWGPSFLFIKVAIEEIPPLTLVVGRVGLAALLLFVILRLQGRELPKIGPVWKHFAVMAFFQNAVPFTLINWGEQYIDSALAAILNGTTPLFTIILAHMFITDDRLNLAKALGVFIGFGGLVLLIAPALFDGVQATIWGLIAVTVAAASYGVAIVYSRLKLRGQKPLVAPTAQLALATLYLLPLAFIFEQPFELARPSGAAIGSLIMMAVFGTALAFVVYYRLIEQASASYVSMVTYLVPIFGVVLGVSILDESLRWNALAGCGLILTGVMFVNGVFDKPFARLQRHSDVAVRT